MGADDDLLGITEHHAIQGEALETVERGGICQLEWELATLDRLIRTRSLELEADPRKEESRHVGQTRARRLIAPCWSSRICITFGRRATTSRAFITKASSMNRFRVMLVMQPTLSDSAAGGTWHGSTSLSRVRSGSDIRILRCPGERGVPTPNMVYRILLTEDGEDAMSLVAE